MTAAGRKGGANKHGQRAGEARDQTRDQAHVWSPPQAPGLTLMRASFKTQTFARHSHEGYGVGVIQAGALAFDYRGAGLVAAQGAVNTVNPDEPHTGRAATSHGWAYRMFYFSPEYLAQVAEAVADGPVPLPFFSSGVIHDPSLAALLLRAHALHDFQHDGLHDRLNGGLNEGLNGGLNEGHDGLHGGLNGGLHCGQRGNPDARLNEGQQHATRENPGGTPRAPATQPGTLPGPPSGPPHGPLPASPDGDSLTRESLLLHAFARLLARHSYLPPTLPRAGAEHAAVARVKAHLRERIGLGCPPSASSNEITPPGPDGHNGLTLAELARVACLSPYHFIRVFARHTGLPPHAWLMQLRARKAGELLRQGAGIAQAAAGAGFADQSHLTRTFKRLLGYTPGQFRNSVQGA